MSYTFKIVIGVGTGELGELRFPMLFSARIDIRIDIIQALK